MSVSKLAKCLAFLGNGTDEEFLGNLEPGVIIWYKEGLGMRPEVSPERLKLRAYDEACDFRCNYKTVLCKEKLLRK